MDWDYWLNTGANIAQIVTGVAAGFFGGRYALVTTQRRWRLESYLKGERAEDAKAGQHGLRTVLHLVAHIGMTEAQILEAAFASSKIKRWTTRDEETGRAEALFLQYDKQGGANRGGAN